MQDNTNKILNEVLSTLKEIQGAVTSDKETTADEFAAAFNAAFNQAQGK